MLPQFVNFILLLFLVLQGIRMMAPPTAVSSIEVAENDFINVKNFEKAKIENES